MGATRVFVDANVFRSKTLRDWLFLLRNESNMFTVCSTVDVIAEVIYSLRREKPGAPGALTRNVHDAITSSLDYRIEDFPEGSPGYLGSDRHDAHVHTAAVAGDVQMVLTADKGFTQVPRDQLDLLPYEVYRPDDFFVLVDKSSPQSVRKVTADQLAYWCQRKPHGGVNLVEALERAGCPQFALRIQERLQEIS